MSINVCLTVCDINTCEKQWIIYMYVHWVQIRVLNNAALFTKGTPSPTKLNQ